MLNHLTPEGLPRPHDRSAPRRVRPRPLSYLPVAFVAILLLVPAGGIGLGVRTAPTSFAVPPTAATPSSHAGIAAQLLAEARASLATPQSSVASVSNNSTTLGWTALGNSSYFQPSARSAAALAYDPQIGAVVLFGGYDASVAADGDTWTFANDTWTDLSGHLAGAPPARWEAGFAYDPNVGAVVLFGGRDVATFFNDTWEFNGTAWSQVSSASSPSPRGLMGMAYDPGLDGILLFGGGTGNVPAGTYSGWVADSDTWLFGLSGSWSNLTPSLTLSPPAVYSPGMAYDNATGQIVLLGGTSSGNTTSIGCSPRAQEWTYNGSTGWYNATSASGALPDGALGLENMGMVWDGALNGIVVYGGIVGLSGCPSTAETWLSTASGWQNLTSFLTGTPPPGNSWFQLAFDPLSAQVVMEGDNDFGSYIAGTWALSGSVGFAAAITATPSYGVAPLNVSLSASLLGGTGPYRYNWTLADGTQVNGTSNTSEQFTAPGVYTVAFSSTDAHGFVAVASQVITVTNATTSFSVVASATPASGPAPLNVSYSSAITPGAPPYSYTWSFGDGSYSTGANPTHTFLGPGIYITNLTVQDRTGAFANSSVGVYVTSPASFSLTVSALPSQGPAPLNVTFTSTSAGGTLPLSYSWSFGDGNVSSAAAPSHTYTSNGNYTATLQVVDALGLTATATATIDVGAAAQVGTWYSTSAPVGPSTRSAPAMAYDPLLSAVVMFGGYGGPAVVALGDTWEFSNGSWTDITGTLSAAPPARWEGAFVYDPLDSSLVLFGGRNVTQFFNDTWTFNGSGWSSVTTPAAPSPRGLSSFTYDPAVGGVVLFGGATGNLPAGSYAGWKFDDDTWEFQSGRWTNLTAALVGAPPPTSSGAMAYDPSVGGDVLYGGTTAPNGCAIIAEQWTLVNSTWTNQSSQALTGPGGSGGLESFGMVYDPGLSGLLVFGGNTERGGTCISTDETWLYSGGNWTNLTSALGTLTPGQRQGEGMAYDATDGYAVIFGGGAPGTVYLDDTWALVAGAAPLAPIPASFTVTGGSGTGPQLVTFTALLGPNEPDPQFQWVYGDGTSGAGGFQVTHLYAVAGQFLPTVTIVLSDGRSAMFHLPEVVIHLTTIGVPSGPPSTTWTSGLLGWADALAVVVGVLGGVALWVGLDRRRDRLRQEGLALIAPAEDPSEPPRGQ